MPKVSVIMPVYNNDLFLSKAIESVLAQSFSDFELVIINDGSTDNSSKIIKDYKNNDSRIVSIENVENRGLIYSLNTGIKKAQGNFIARLDSDDWWLDVDKLKKQVNYLENNVECGLVGSFAKVFDQKEIELYNLKYPTTDAEIRKEILIKNCFIHSSVLFRKSLAIVNGLYLEKEKYVEDYGLWMRIGEKNKFANIPEYSVGYLLNEQGETQKNNLRLIKANLKLIKKYKIFYPNYFLGFLKWVFKYVLVYFGGLKIINKMKTAKL